MEKPSDANRKRIAIFVFSCFLFLSINNIIEAIDENVLWKLIVSIISSTLSIGLILVLKKQLQVLESENGEK